MSTKNGEFTEDEWDIIYNTVEKNARRLVGGDTFLSTDNLLWIYIDDITGFVTYKDLQDRVYVIAEATDEI